MVMKVTKFFIIIFTLTFFLYIFNLHLFNTNYYSAQTEAIFADYRIGQNKENIVVITSQKGKVFDVRIIQKDILSIFDKEYQLITNLQNGYFEDYVQTNYIYLFGKLYKYGKTYNPASATDTYLSWFPSVSFFPEVTAIEIKYVSDGGLIIENPKFHMVEKSKNI